MNLAKHYQPGQVAVSFELFPPKTEIGEATLMQHVKTLHQFRPAYFTCTYGAGGSTQSKTLSIISQVKSFMQTPVASHLTCVSATIDQLRDYLRSAEEQGVDYLVALRGDPPKGETNFVPAEGGLRYANELVTLIRNEFPSFGIAVAGYPEVHQEAASPEADLENLKRKVDCGADIIITQLFYINEDFFRFRDSCEKAGIGVPIIPGILPVTNLGQIQRITRLCGAKLPEPFVTKLAERDDEEWQMQVGIDQAVQQTRELIDSGVAGLHFYVLNQSHATSRVLSDLEYTGASV